MPVKDSSLEGKSKDSERRVLDGHELEGSFTRDRALTGQAGVCLFWQGGGGVERSKQCFYAL
jgi:hypothetical protein